MKYRRILYCVIIYLVFFNSILAADGHWFGKKKILPAGFEFKQLQITDKNEYSDAIFSRLSYNESRGWEEFRLKGRLKDDHFRPEYCTVYRTKKLNHRWKLHHAFECEHLSFKLFFKKDKIVITPGFNLKNNEELVFAGSGRIYGKLVLDRTLWGTDMRRVRKGAVVEISSGNKKILSVSDSTAGFDGRSDLKGEPVFQIINPSSGSLFD